MGSSVEIKPDVLPMQTPAKISAPVVMGTVTRNRRKMMETTQTDPSFPTPKASKLNAALPPMGKNPKVKKEAVANTTLSLQESMPPAGKNKQVKADSVSETPKPPLQQIPPTGRRGRPRKEKAATPEAKEDVAEVMTVRARRGRKADIVVAETPMAPKLISVAGSMTDVGKGR